MIKPTARLTVRLLRLVILLVIIAVIAVGAILLKPMWVSSLIEQELYRHGVQADISTLNANFSGTTYQLSGHVRAKAPHYGVAVEKADFRVTADWWAGLKGKPFITVLNVGQTAIELDRPQLMRSLDSRPKTAKSSAKNIQRFLPLHWQVNDTTLKTEGQTLYLAADGQQIHQVSATVKDTAEGVLLLRYLQASNVLTIAGKQIDLKPLTGQPAVLQQLQAAINTKHWLASRAEGFLDYQEMHSHIQLTGQDSQLLIQAQSGGKSVSVVAQPIANQGVNLMFDHVDLSVFQTLQPLLPQAYEWARLQGFVDGTVTAFRDKGLTSAQLILDNVGVSHSIGGINHVSGAVNYRNGVVAYQTQLNNSKATLPSVFPRGVAALSGAVDGTFDIAAQTVSLQQVDLHSKDFEQLSTSGMIDLGKQSIDLSAKAENVDISHRRSFLPPSLPSSVNQWLGDALVSGKKNHSTLTLRGKFKELFKSPNSVFLLKTQLKQTVFHYLDSNPDILIQQGILTINQRQLTVDIPKGSVKGIPIVGSASINDLSKAVVQVDVSFKPQSVQKLLPIAEKSIAKDSIHAVNNLLTAKGKLAMNLSLNLPVWHKKAENTFDIELSGDALSTTLKAYPLLPITQAKANVLINQRGLKQLTLHGKQGSQPIKVTLTRDKAENYRSQVNITANAAELLKKLALLSEKQKGLIARYHLIGGVSPYQAEIVIDKNGNFQQVKAQSTLVGTTLNAFNLLQKTAKTTLPLTLTYTAKHRRLNLSLKKRLDLSLSLTKSGQLAGLLLDNRKMGRTYRQGKIQVYWHSKRFNFNKLDNFRLAWQDISKKSKAAMPAYQYQFDVDVKAIQVSDNKQTEPLNIKGNLSNLAITSPFATGKVNYQKNHLTANFASLDFSRLLNFFSKTEINPEGQKVAKIDLAKALPQMQVTIDRLIYKGNNVGNANIRTSIQGGRYSIDQLFVRGSHYFFEASGYEAKEPQGITTHIQADFKGEKIKQIVALLKLTPMLDGKFIDVSATLSWPGKAHTLNLRQSYGKIKLNAQNVKLTQISSGVGGVIGLMDIAGILKRISLDFKNLSSSKVSFDTVQGNWNIGGGRAMTRDAYATGSLIDLKWTGAADLHRRVFDNIKITVIPKASNVIPVVGAVAGGVVGAVIGVVVQQVAGDVMNKAVGLPYRLSGKWIAPVLTSGNKVLAKDKKNQPAPPKITLESIE